MPRPEKVQAVADIKSRIEGARAVFLAEYAGLSVKDQQELRRSLRESGAEFKVVKMSMARLAAADLDIDSLSELLLGPTGITYADSDAAGTAKVLKDFAKTHESFVVKGGLLGLEFLPPEKIAELAELEPREVILAKLAGVMQAPMANLAGLLVALPRNTASVLQQLLEKKESAEPEAPAVEAAPVESTESAEADDEGSATAELASADADVDGSATAELASADADVDGSATAELASAEAGDGDESDEADGEDPKTEETDETDDGSATAELASAEAGDGDESDEAAADAGADDKDESSAESDDEE